MLLHAAIPTAPTVWERAADLFDSSKPVWIILGSLVTLSAVVSAAGAVLVALKKLWKKCISPYRVYVKFVDRLYSKENRKAISKYYIPTRAQDIDPCEQDEIRDNNGKFFSQPLIPFFCKEAFRESSRGKYYLILADSGMGKTTFLLRLYRECLLGAASRNRTNVEMIPLSQQNCLRVIQSIENPGDTILLLDALDENIDAINDYESFFHSLLVTTERFYKVVITCRTQFFPNRELEPTMTGRIQTGPGKKAEEIVKKYLSPFSDEEVKLYLKKRFRFRKKMQEKEYLIVKKVPVLMARPIILNWIDFLCSSSESYKYSYQIYGTIIEKWIEREDLGSRKLFELSCAISDYMFRKDTTSMPAKIVEEIAATKEINLEPIIAKSRSLLNRNGAGEYKFAHRSFLEYFIVFGIFEKMRMPAKTDFLFSLSGAKRFLFEILLQTAELTNSENIESVEKQITKYKRYLRATSILEFVQNPNAHFMRWNNANGFIIEANVSLNESDLYDPHSIVEVDGIFVETAWNAVRLHQNKPIQISLVFDVRDENNHPQTVIEFKVVQ